MDGYAPASRVVARAAAILATSADTLEDVVRKPLERYLEIAAGLTGVTAQTAERLVQRLVKEGEVAADRAERIVADLLALSQRNRELVTELVRTEVDRAMARLTPTAAVDVEELADRVVQRLRADGVVLTAPAGRETDASPRPRRSGAST